jgi:hypothetical protein
LCFSILNYSNSENRWAGENPRVGHIVIDALAGTAVYVYERLSAQGVVTESTITLSFPALIEISDPLLITISIIERYNRGIGKLDFRGSFDIFELNRSGIEKKMN